MWKHSVALVLAGSAFMSAFMPVAQAQTDNLWLFSYTGFAQDGVFDPDYQVTGSFTGTDTNADGVIEQAEISRFVWDRFLLTPPDAYCSGYNSCTLSDFSYSPSGGLAFELRWMYSDERAYATGSTIAGDSMYYYGSLGDDDAITYTWDWTDQTRFEIIPPPVPEPGQYLMVVAGLLGMRAWRAASARPSRTGPRV